MKWISLTITLLVFSHIQAQDSCNILVNNRPLKTIFYYKGAKIKPDNLAWMVQPIPEAKKLISKAQNSLITSRVLGTFGGLAMGIPLGIKFTGGTPNWNIFYVGLGLTALSATFELRFSKLAKKAAKIYNEKNCTGLTLKIAPDQFTLSYSL